MTKNELLTLADREAARLTEENDHCAAAIIRSLCECLRAEADQKISIGPIKQGSQVLRYDILPNGGKRASHEGI